MPSQQEVLILLIGDSFLIDEKYKEILHQFQQSHPGEVAKQTAALSDTPLESVLREAATLPFFASGLILRIRDLAKIKKSENEMLKSYCEKPYANTLLIFEAQELEKNHLLFTLAQTAGKIYELKGQDHSSQARAYARERFKSAGRNIQPAALELLVERCGDQLSFMDSMIQSLIGSSSAEEIITEDAVEALGENWTDTNLFDLTRAIGNRKTSEALEVLAKLLDEVDDPYALVGTLHWQVRRLWEGSMLLDEGASQAVIQQKVKISPRQIGFFMKEIRRYKRQQLEKVLEGLYQLDWKIKTGRADFRTALEAWLVSATS